MEKKFLFIIVIILQTVNIYSHDKVSFDENISKIENHLYHVVKDTLIPDSRKKEGGIVVLARAYSDSIVLRFAPPDYAFWLRAQQSGFVIKRGKDSTDLKQIATVLPIPLNQIDTALFSKDSFALMAAGLLYGKADRSKIQGYMQEYRANKQTLDMSLLVSEFSQMAATILGLRYVDKSVLPGESYYYEISNSVYKEKKFNGLIHVNNVIKPDRAPYQFSLSEGDEQLTLHWSKDYNARAFTYYMIERSDDNKNFYPITERPLVFYQSKTSQAIPDFSYVDSFNLINDTKYYYRLFGGNSFGEFSPAALAEATPRDLTPPVAPKITNASYDYKSQVLDIEWDYDIENLTADFSYIQVSVSRDEKGPYNALSGKLGLSDFYFTHSLGPEISEDMEGRYFFRIDCYDESGNKSYSDFLTAFVPDFTNPQVPDSLVGYIDSLSFVNIHWPKSKSKDVRGYWLYWANSPDAEFSLVSQTIINDTTYKYYIEEKSLTKNIFYTLRAEDFAYNRSDAAIVLKLKRRDIVPPSTPMIKGVYTDSLKLKIDIMPSASDDVQFYELFRRENDTKDTAWILLDTFFSKNLYIDLKANLNQHYEYKLRAIDSTGNISSFSSNKGGVLKATVQDIEIKEFKLQQVKNSNAVELNWKYIPAKQLQDKKYKFIIYRSTGHDGVKYYQEVDSEITTFNDSKLNNNVLYNYAISVRFEDGLASQYREIKSLIIK